MFPGVFTDKKCYSIEFWIFLQANINFIKFVIEYDRILSSSRDVGITWKRLKCSSGGARKSVWNNNYFTFGITEPGETCDRHAEALKYSWDQSGSLMHAVANLQFNPLKVATLMYLFFNLHVLFFLMKFRINFVEVTNFVNNFNSYQNP